ncbi:cell division protein CrgA [Rothia sp. P6271]|uniref:cell division protein CrgA n=1 Tax=unclassified Rothia (in: high G+C Gram-positive bacteria) TaxID=2689056 RepID=UPI003ACCF68A
MAEDKKVMTDSDLHEEETFRRIAKEMVTDDFASPTPLWYQVIMFGLVVLGILWIMVFYISETTLPIPGLSMWNVAIGVGLMMAGLLMMTRWR